LFGSSKRVKSPTAATIEIPAIASTPGIVINPLASCCVRYRHRCVFESYGSVC
jgi:hypothetical protein